MPDPRPGTRPDPRPDPREARCADPGAVRAELARAGIGVRDMVWRGARLALLRAPCPEGRPMLLLHGVTYSSASVFDLAVPGRARGAHSTLLQLARRGVDAWALDMAGYGLSDARRDPGEETVEHCACQVLAAARHVVGASGLAPVLAGWSWGAQVAARCVAARPDLFAGLVFWGGMWGGTGRLSRMRALPLPTHARRANGAAHAAADFLTPGAFDPAVRDAFVARALALDPSSPTTGLRESILNLPTHDPARIARPTLVVRGAHDPVGDPADTEDYAAALPAGLGRLLRLAGADHNAQHGHARAALFDALAGFRAEIDAPRPASLEPTA